MIQVLVQFQRRDFSLDVEFQSAEGVTGIFGGSGAGKTTLINLIAGLERPDRGMVAAGERTLYDSRNRIDVPVHRRRVGVAFQEHRLFPHYSVAGNLRYARRGRADFDRVVGLLELGGLLGKRVHQLSGGERQRVALGRALLSEPRLLLLDEPLASLDHRLRQQIIPFLRRIRDELALPMLYVSHDLTEILQLTDRLLILERGRSVGHGRYGDLVHFGAVQAVIHDRGMDNVITARVAAHQPADGISLLDIGMEKPSSLLPNQLIAPLFTGAVGGQVLISIRPWDVALASKPVAGVSIQNQIRGVVTRCSNHERSSLVEVDIGAPILVEISRRSVATLNIDIGREITCLIKTRAIQYIGTV